MRIEDRVFFLTLSGSHAYGMARPESDVDIRGLAIPPVNYFHGYHSRFAQCQAPFPLTKSLADKISNAIGRKLGEKEEVDSVVYDIRKFFSLAAECNPNIIELLFTDEKFHLISHPLMKVILEERNLFLSQKANFRFRGYAFLN